MKLDNTIKRVRKMYGKKLWESTLKLIPDKKICLSALTSYNLFTKRHIFFSLSRYKFCSKMIGPKKNILEFGCNDGLGSIFFIQENCSYLGVDFQTDAIAWAKENLEMEKVRFQEDDFLNKKFGAFDALVSLDVIEHLEKKKEKVFLSTIVNNLKEDGICLIGTPNITAQKYASKESNAGHVNMFDADRLKKLLLTSFKNVFLFSMNDEVVHTGFYPMSHYLIALACYPSKTKK